LPQQGATGQEKAHANAKRHRALIQRRIRLKDKHAKADFEQPRQQRHLPTDKAHHQRRRQPKTAIEQKSPAKQHRQNQPGSMLPVDDQQPQQQKRQSARSAQGRSSSGLRCRHQQQDQRFEQQQIAKEMQREIQNPVQRINEDAHTDRAPDNARQRQRGPTLADEFVTEQDHTQADHMTSLANRGLHNLHGFQALLSLIHRHVCADAGNVF